MAPLLLLNVPAVAPVNPSDHTAEVAPPPNEPPRATVVPPWQITAKADPADTVGFGLIISVLFADIVPHEPPDVTNASVTVAGADADAVYVAVPGVLPVLLLNVPAVRPVRPSDHIADVAPPPKEPPRATDVPPWQIAGIADPAKTVGVGFMVSVLVTARVPHEPPEVNSVRVTDAGADADAV